MLVTILLCCLRILKSPLRSRMSSRLSPPSSWFFIWLGACGISRQPSTWGTMPTGSVPMTSTTRLTFPSIWPLSTGQQLPVPPSDTATSCLSTTMSSFGPSSSSSSVSLFSHISWVIWALNLVRSQDQTLWTRRGSSKLTSSIKSSRLEPTLSTNSHLTSTIIMPSWSLRQTRKCRTS